MDGINEWLESRLDGREPTRSQRDIFRHFRTQPRQTSYGSVTDVAEAVGTTASTVTRAAQTLGFRGWSDFQREYRTRYLSVLTAVEVRDQHESTTGSASAKALGLARDHCAHLSTALDHTQVQGIARKLAGARRIWVVAGGSYAVPARALVHNARIAGYDARLLGSEVAVLATSLAGMTGDDAVAAFSLWRPYASTELAVRHAHDIGAHVTAITDDEMSEVGRSADECLVVPSESSGFFPSLVPSLLCAEMIVAELAEVDREFSRKAISSAEAMWDQMEIMRRRS